MKRLFLAFALLVIGCGSPASNPKFHAVGTVRYVNFDTYHCYWNVVIEGDDKSVFSIHGAGCGIPPVWVGLHAEVTYELDSQWGDNNHYKNLIVVRRLS
jgi:hypothetical protein